MRIKTEFWVGALRRRVEAAGGFATIIAKGEPDSGAVLLILREPGGLTTLSRVNTGDGKVSWQPIFENREERDPAAQQALEKRRKFDPDLWIVELDVENPGRFIDKD
ncbi:DUF1491 family protein [Sphingosinicella soli]|uniref:DUF1491 domain-containing protein n=1 Tax=Sphingosinicella soli TaxID=333708 RepID=A0A7W7B2Z8_9SPHN|nr:DUF1491 family protein [Sphingosinicella soli]MBB4633086.1 hypothetical protein [Sphingosinicella soli]